MNFDVIIIGAGVTGAAIARELSHYRLKVLLLEKEACPAFGVSKSAVGIIESGVQNTPGSLKGKLCVEGNRILREELDRELSLGFKRRGQLITSFSEADTERLKIIKFEGEALGIPGAEIVGRDWMDEKEPGLSAEVKAALFCPTAGTVNPYIFILSLLESALANGAELKVDSKVSGVRRCSDGLFEVSAGRIKYLSRFIVNAAGFFADEISALAGIKDFKIARLTGEGYVLDGKPGCAVKSILSRLPSGDPGEATVAETSEGRISVGPGAWHKADEEDPAAAERRKEEILRAAGRLFPSLSEKGVNVSFSCPRPECGDDFIVLYGDNVPGFINVAGLRSSGLTAAPAVAVKVRKILGSHGLDMNLRNNFISLSAVSPCDFKILSEENPKGADGCAVRRGGTVPARAEEDAWPARELLKAA